MKYFLAGILALSTIFQCVDMKIGYNTHPHQISKSTVHYPQVIRKTCLLYPDNGPCRSNINMYYFIPSNLTCGVFKWGGCQGNGNRFDSIEECQVTCLSKPNEKNTRPRFCQLSFDYGYCFGAVTRYYYDHLWKVCKETIYSGCGGNKNHFYSKEQCESVCRFGIGAKSNMPAEKASLKKVLIINSLNTTPHRGRDQSVTQATTAAI